MFYLQTHTHTHTYLLFGKIYCLENMPYFTYTHTHACIFTIWKDGIVLKQLFAVQASVGQYSPSTPLAKVSSWPLWSQWEGDTKGNGHAQHLTSWCHLMNGQAVATQYLPVNTNV